MKSKNTSTSKYILFGVLFIVTAVVTFISMNYQSEVAATTTMTEATLPVVMMQTEKGTLYNRLHGYTREMNEALMNLEMTPLPTDKKLPIVIDTYNQEITALSYKVRDANDLSLIENTPVADYEITPERVSAKLNIKNLIEDNTPYILEISVSTQGHENIYYYTKIISGTDYHLQDKIDFVLEFNHNTFDGAALGKISKYLETSKDADNSNYGRVNINCTQEQVGWGDLNPYVESNIVPSVCEIDGEVAMIVLEYTMGAENDYDAYDTYTVHEFYRIRQTNTSMYLLNYERTASQVFDGRNDLLSSGKINLGIHPDTNVTAFSNEKHTITYFVNQGTLWCYDGVQNLYTRVFTFEGEDSDNVRERYNRHHVKIMEVSEDGSATFMIYGYMNRGAHEGEMGVSLCSYRYGDNQVEELLYIPVNVPYEVLSVKVGEVAYVSENNSFYILIDGTLYSIELNSKEVMTEISGLTEGTYAVSENGRSIAYSMNGSLYDTDAIRIFNMEQGTEHILRAEEGDRLSVLGYINNDFIFGMAHAADILKEENGNTVFPMYKLQIMNMDYQVIKEYEQAGVYVSAAQVMGQRINLTRVIRDGAGGYESASVDQLINRDENNSSAGYETDTITTAARKQETVLVLENGVGSVHDVAMRASEKVEFKQDGNFELKQEITGAGRYYVYGFGAFQGSYLKASDAIIKANATFGSVFDGNNRAVWRRARNSAASIKGLSSRGCSASDSLAVSVDIIMRYAGHESDARAAFSEGKNAVEVLDGFTDGCGLNLKGASAEHVLPLVSAGFPVIAAMPDGYVIISGYDASGITYLEPQTGAEKSILLEEANKLFTQAGNVFISYYK